MPVYPARSIHCILVNCGEFVDWENYIILFINISKRHFMKFSLYELIEIDLSIFRMLELRASNVSQAWRAATHMREWLAIGLSRAMPRLHAALSPEPLSRKARARSASTCRAESRKNDAAPSEEIVITPINE